MDFTIEESSDEVRIRRHVPQEMQQVSVMIGLTST
jgi:hypothetical protein